MPFTLLLRCHNLEETHNFYHSVLGFNVAGTVDTLTVEKHDGKLIFTVQDHWQSQPVFSGTISFKIPYIDGFFASIKDATSVTWQIQDMLYDSRDFRIQDYNGYYLAFQQQA